MHEKYEPSKTDEEISDRDLFYNARYGNNLKDKATLIARGTSTTRPLPLEGETTVDLGVGVRPHSLRLLPANITCIGFTYHFFRRPFTEEYFSDLMNNLPKSVKWVDLGDLSKIDLPIQAIIFKSMPSDLNVYSINFTNTPASTPREGYQLSNKSTGNRPRPSLLTPIVLPKPVFSLLGALGKGQKRRRTESAQLAPITNQCTITKEPAPKRIKLVSINELLTTSSEVEKKSEITSFHLFHQPLEQFASKKEPTPTTKLN